MEDLNYKIKVFKQWWKTNEQKNIKNDGENPKDSGEDSKSKLSSTKSPRKTTNIDYQAIF